MKKTIHVIFLLSALFISWKYKEMKIDKEIAEFNCQMKIFKYSQNTPALKDEL